MVLICTYLSSCNEWYKDSKIKWHINLHHIDGTQDFINGVKLHDTMTCALTPIVIQGIDNTCSNECECMFCSVFGCKETLI
jgi:hypothetical protein